MGFWDSKIKLRNDFVKSFAVHDFYPFTNDKGKSEREKQSTSNKGKSGEGDKNGGLTCSSRRLMNMQTTVSDARWNSSNSAKLKEESRTFRRQRGGTKPFDETSKDNFKEREGVEVIVFECEENTEG